MKPTSNGNGHAGRRIGPAKDRRSEPRFEAAGAGELTVFDTTPYSNLSGTVVDVSRSGFQVELAVPLEPGASVELRLTKVKLSGVVVSCRKCGEDRYRVCLTTTLYIESPRAGKSVRK